MVKNMKKVISCALLIGIATLTGCMSQPEKMPEYIGYGCSFTDKSRIIESNKFYAICKNNKWKAVPADEFKDYIIKPPEDQPYTSSLIMRDSDSQSGQCISVKQHYTGFKDYDMDGETILRSAISGKICGQISCDGNSDIQPYDVRWCK